MGKFQFQKTPIEGLYVIEPTVSGDHNKKEFFDAGLTMEFVQNNESFSRKGVLRGMHFQKRKPQGKLVRVTNGEVFDVAVDLRERSATCGRWYGVTLSVEKKNQFYIPEGFAHGFLVLSETASFVYQCTNLYDPADEGGFAWDDTTVGIRWRNFTQR